MQKVGRETGGLVNWTLELDGLILVGLQQNQSLFLGFQSSNNFACF